MDNSNSRKFAYKEKSIKTASHQILFQRFLSKIGTLHHLCGQRRQSRILSHRHCVQEIPSGRPRHGDR